MTTRLPARHVNRNVRTAAWSVRRSRYPAAFASHIFDDLQRCHSLFVSREREAMTVGTATGPLLPGPVRGTQFHPRGPALRRLATHADHRHRHARAGVGRSAVSSKTFDRLDGAWARGAALPERSRAQRG